MLYHWAMRALSNYIRREWLSLMLAAVLTVFAISLIIGPLGPRDLLALRAHRRRLEAKREELLANDLTLRTSVQNLQSNDRYLERLVRKELGFTRSDELVYKFVTNSTNPQH